MPRFVLVVLVLSLSFASACLFGGGGCGCGCGGGGGCGGRKKREAGFGPEDSPHKVYFDKMSANATDLLCNSVELKRTILEAMQEDITTSKREISNVLESLGDRFVVVCSRNPFEFAVRHDTEYCAVNAYGHTCQAFAL